MANIETNGSMTISSRGGKTVYEADRDIFVNGKNVGRKYEVTGQNSGSVRTGGNLNVFGGTINSASSDAAREAARASREAGRKARDQARAARDQARAIREQAKLHKKMHGY